MSKKKNPVFNKVAKYKQFLLWHKGICEFHVLHNKEQALVTLQSALELNKQNNRLVTEEEVEILNSMAVIHFETGDYAQALGIYNDCISNLEDLPLLKEPNIKTRLLYNKGKALTRIKEFHSSIKCCEQGVENCNSNDSLYLLGELVYHIGYNYELIENKKLALDHYQKALTLFKVQNNVKYIDYVEVKIRELSL